MTLCPSRAVRLAITAALMIGSGTAGSQQAPAGDDAATVAWRQWQLPGDSKAVQYFVGTDCGRCVDPGWTVAKKRID